MAGLAQGTVWRLENGFPEAHPLTIRKLAEVLGIEPRELVRSRE
jgi:transcriptional regulator with XRE-family HTH domain